MKENKGQITIEMCFIMPMAAGVVFMAIYLFMHVMNRGIASGEIYTILYTKEAYLLGQEDMTEESIKDILQSELSNNLSNSLHLVKAIDVEVNMESAGGIISSYTEPGFISGQVSCNMDCKGLFMLVSDTLLSDRIYGKQELRDTSNNLRRWQIYGKILQN